MGVRVVDTLGKGKPTIRESKPVRAPPPRGGSGSSPRSDPTAPKEPTSEPRKGTKERPFTRKELEAFRRSIDRPSTTIAARERAAGIGKTRAPVRRSTIIVDKKGKQVGAVLLRGGTREGRETEADIFRQVGGRLKKVRTTRGIPEAVAQDIREESAFLNLKFPKAKKKFPKAKKIQLKKKETEQLFPKPKEKVKEALFTPAVKPFREKRRTVKGVVITTAEANIGPLGHKIIEEEKKIKERIKSIDNAFEVLRKKYFEKPKKALQSKPRKAGKEKTTLQKISNWNNTTLLFASDWAKSWSRKVAESLIIEGGKFATRTVSVSPVRAALNVASALNFEKLSEKDKKKIEEDLEVEKSRNLKKILNAPSDYLKGIGRNANEFRKTGDPELAAELFIDVVTLKLVQSSKLASVKNTALKRATKRASADALPKGQQTLETAIKKGKAMDKARAEARDLKVKETIKEIEFRQKRLEELRNKQTNRLAEERINNKVKEIEKGLEKGTLSKEALNKKIIELKKDVRAVKGPIREKIFLEEKKIIELKSSILKDTMNSITDKLTQKIKFTTRSTEVKSLLNKRRLSIRESLRLKKELKTLVKESNRLNEVTKQEKAILKSKKERKQLEELTRRIEKERIAPGKKILEELEIEFIVKSFKEKLSKIKIGGIPIKQVIKKGEFSGFVKLSGKEKFRLANIKAILKEGKLPKKKLKELQKELDALIAKSDTPLLTFEAKIRGPSAKVVAKIRFLRKNKLDMKAKIQEFINFTKKKGVTLEQIKEARVILIKDLVAIKKKGLEHFKKISKEKRFFEKQKKKQVKEAKFFITGGKKRKIIDAPKGPRTRGEYIAKLREALKGPRTRGEYTAKLREALKGPRTGEEVAVTTGKEQQAVLIKPKPKKAKVAPPKKKAAAPEGGEPPKKGQVTEPSFPKEKTQRMIGQIKKQLPARIQSNKGIIALMSALKSRGGIKAKIATKAAQKAGQVPKAIEKQAGKLANDIINEIGTQITPKQKISQATLTRIEKLAKQTTITEIVQLTGPLPPGIIESFRKLPPFKLKKLLEDLKKKKKKGKPTKFTFEFTPTLAGIGQVAKQTKGTFTGFEVRGNIIRFKPVKVKKHSRRNAKSVKRHRRRTPRRKS